MTEESLVGPSMNIPRETAGMDPLHFASSDIRPTDKRVVAVTIGVRANYKVGDREFSGPMAMHQVPIAKRFYELLGGSLSIEPGWLPLLPRHRRLTRDDLIREMENIRTTYRIPRTTGVQEVSHEFFGNEPAQQVVRLHALMRDQQQAWNRAVRAAKELLLIRRKDDPTFLQMPNYEREAAVYDYLTAQDLMDIVGIGQPSLQSIPDLAEIEVPALDSVKTDEGAAMNFDELNRKALEMADADDKNDPSLALVERARSAGLTERQALELASLVALADAPANITDDDLVKVLGSKAKLTIARSVIGG